MNSERPVRVLLIDDDEDDFIITRDYLAEIKSQSYVIDWVNSFDSGRQTAFEQSHDVYLVDYRLGVQNGLELVKEILAGKPHTPVILLTGLGDTAVDQAAMRAGADDYLVKGQITAALLERSIRHAILRRETEAKLRTSEERLRHAQKIEALGTLAGGIAHDFNNILAIIRGYTDRIGGGGLSEDQTRKCVLALNQAVDRGASLVRQILAFARKAEPQFDLVQVNEVIREAGVMVSHTFPRNIIFKFDLEPNLPLISADASQLHQVLLNLCVNARDAMPDGGRLTIRSSLVSGESLRETIEDATAERYVLITVADTGMGMDEKTQQRVFEPFFSTKGPDRGTGLGLATVYGIMKSHNGGIELNSSVGAGSSFTVHFPVPAATDRMEKQENALEAGSLAGTGTVLVVEDEELLLRLMRATLREHGYEVITARDGKEGLALFSERSKEINLVLTDLGLPVMSGKEMVQGVLKICPSAKCIVATGYIEQELKKSLMEMGVAGILQKPYAPEELLSLVSVTLRSQ